MTGSIAQVEIRRALPAGATFALVPTPEPRYTVTDTGELREHLDRAERHLPELRRKELLLRLVAVGQKAVEEEAADRVRAVEETAGALSGVYEPRESEGLLGDWPD